MWNKENKYSLTYLKIKGWNERRAKVIYAFKVHHTCIRSKTDWFIINIEMREEKKIVSTAI